MYGWSEEEALAMNVRALIPDGKREEAVTQLKQLCNSKGLAPYRTQRLARDGGLVKVVLTATALVNSAGEVYAVCTTERGIS
jgi:two-component system CheB/CheR fusion protein